MSAATAIADRIAAAFASADGAHQFSLCFTEDAVQHHPFFPEPAKGREAIEAAESPMFAGFSDVRLTPLRVVDGADGWAAIQWQVVATNTGELAMPDGSVLPPTGVTVDLQMASVIHLTDDGLIDEEQRYQDNLAFLRHLGLA